MKLFITNKSDFEKVFDEPYRFENTNRNPLTSKQIHQKAFAILSKSIDIDHSIPLIITTSYDYGDGDVILDFINKRDDIYYYEYSGTVS